MVEPGQASQPTEPKPAVEAGGDLASSPVGTTDQPQPQGAREYLKSKITGKNADKRLEAALLYISGVCTSPTRLGEKMGVSKNTILNWRKWDGWVKLQGQVNGETVARLPGGLAAFKLSMIARVEGSLAMIDKYKKSTKPRNLEGLLKTEDALITKLLLLRGEATSRDEVHTFAWEPYVEQGRREPVKIRGTVVGEGSADGGAKLAGEMAQEVPVEEDKAKELPAEPEGGRKAMAAAVGGKREGLTLAQATTPPRREDKP